ncbi:hypothetical protein DSO57_1002388 [Entomophthora muscae]|uniref:Uncharacterized protein n=1 Tax=Entomophthora muscae TaxID=34485 RepID=A0ACC2RNQ8_9FUNG|nr:hypothetical protein DSO57_1002388 [Entomophthora muscae]
MLQEALARLTHGKGASKWAVTAYKDDKLVRLDPVNFSGVYCVNSTELFETFWQRSHSRMYQRWARLMQLLASATPWSTPYLSGPRVPWTVSCPL